MSDQRLRTEDGQAAEPSGQGLLAGEVDGAPSLSEAGLQELQHAFTSEVVAGVREVEALVAEREIGDLRAADGEREREPVVE